MHTGAIVNKLGTSIVVFALLVLNGVAWGAEFSADVVQTVGGMKMAGKIYVKKEKIRTEINTQGQEMVHIMDLEDKKIITLMPSQKMYMEMKAGDEMLRPYQSGEQLAGAGSMKHLGKETVEGYSCEKYLIIYNGGKLGSSTYWIAKKLGHPIKITSKGPQGESVTEYKNIKEGGVDDALFKPPSGYTKVPMPMMGHGMDMPQGFPGIGK